MQGGGHLGKTPLARHLPDRFRPVWFSDTHAVVETASREVTGEAWTEDEAERLAALHRLDLLDTPPEREFDRLTRLAADLFGVPVALVSLIDADRQWFKSCIGLGAAETPRRHAFCAHAIRSPSEVMVVPDASADPRFADNPLVTGAPGIRFYAGAPVFGPEGHPLGTLCILDTCPRPALSSDEMRRLADLAAIASAQIAARRAIGEVDGVTGLPNRFRLLADLRAPPLSASGGAPTHIAVVDAVEPATFARLVRALGHACGDMLAIAAARHVEAVVPEPSPRLYHLDGCRFCLPLSARDNAEAGLLAGALASQLAAAPLVACGGVPMPIRPAVGVASLPNSAAGHLQAVRAAASAAQAAAERGLGWSLHDPARDAAQRRGFALLSALDAALAGDAAGGSPFRLAWQPRIDLRTGACVAAEALLRWRHSTLGEVPPGEFIPLLEGTALMPRLTDRVLAAALAQARRWRDDALPLEVVSVNISAQDLADDALAERVRRALDAAGVDPGGLELEFTETAAAAEPDKLGRRLGAVRDLGVHVALDDFGAGYSNLTYLRRVPATAAKLDRELVAPAVRDTRARAVVRAAASLLRELGLRVVAEGIETEADVQAMRDCGCDEGQGFLFSPPLEGEAFADWLRARAAQASRAG
jgi:EAL domain-containing protein (putative c-di-GMP-specific phosphodiesterase class I)